LEVLSTSKHCLSLKLNYLNLLLGGGEGSTLGAGLLGFGLGVGGTLLAQNFIGAQQRYPCRYRRDDGPEPSARFLPLGGGLGGGFGGGGYRPCPGPYPGAYPGGFGGGYPVGGYPGGFNGGYPGPVGGYPVGPVGGYPVGPVGGYPVGPVGGYPVGPVGGYPVGGYPGGYPVGPAYPGAYPGAYAPSFGFRSAPAEGSESTGRLLGGEGGDDVIAA